MNLILTGATGFLGRVVCRELARDHQVTAVSRAEPSPPLPLPTKTLIAELSDAALQRGLSSPAAGLVHLAQSRRYRDFPDGAADTFAVNVAATAALLEHARLAGAERFVLASTGSLYAPRPAPLDEEAPLQPETFYATSKLLAEQLVAAYRAFFTTTVLRFFFVYGPGQRQMLIPNLIETIRAGRPVTLHGADGFRLNPVHVSDAARAVGAALESTGHQVVNVAGAETVTLGELARRLGRLLGVAPRFVHASEPPPDRIAGIDRMERELGVTPQVTLDEGLAETVAAAGR